MPKLRDRAVKVFEQPQEQDSADAAIYGQIGKPVIDTGRVVAKPIDIFSIVPDLTQPRRAVPSQFHGYRNENPPELLKQWQSVAFAEMDFSTSAQLVAAKLDSSRESEDDAPSFPERVSFIEIVSLAASIKRDGLTNPVSVSLKGQQYQLETGERRWLAYHLLLLYSQDEKWKRIPARVMDAVDPWRQASENTARQDLNAIGRARQYAKLLMTLYSDRRFVPYEECETDQQYYQQAVDLRPPYGTGDLLLNAMGLKHRAAFSRCRKLLSLPPDIWIQADDENWPEDRLIEIVATRNDSVIPNEPPAPPGDASRSEVEPLISREKQRDFGKFLKLAHKAGQGDGKARRMALGYVAEQRKWLDEVERWLQYGE